MSQNEHIIHKAYQLLINILQLHGSPISMACNVEYCDDMIHLSEANKKRYSIEMWQWIKPFIAMCINTDPD